jgi:hypothetical protein
MEDELRRMEEKMKAMQQKLLQKKNVSQVPNFFAETNHF